MPEPLPRPAAPLRLVLALALTSALGGVARAQIPPPRVPELEERSGLVMRFTDVPGSLPPDKYRDNFYATRYADKGAVKHLRINPKDQGLYGLGWKAADTESVYPFFYGNPGSSTITAATKPWPRPLRVFQGMAHPYKPVGMYYSNGSYVPIYDVDPVVPGPGPYPFPFYFNWNKGG
ncbi:hypothetical protein [Paludisphaera mucosa]|uniref:DUF4185 domain-containing protein n=1 Tax=Paludisphaera mucosa TaxID=3030827 RepID=A0ABT6FJ02_9BACT|nr:hypothetical protein [Paludisphaera mucosa]MDG3007333.1 hypothetical protein [Paludisphaera mucosa]